MTNSVVRANGEKVLGKEAAEKEAPSGCLLEVINGTERLPYAVQRRLEVVQRLQRYQGRADYSAEQTRGAQELGVSLRSLQRFQRQYREQGLDGLKRQGRSDQGQPRVSEDWREFILKTYRKGNRGTRSTSRAQVAKRVESRAAELGDVKYPSRPSVYRILAPELKRAEQKQKRRAIGWSGETMQLRTREGLEIDIDYSNQVWQCDHTPADILVVDRSGGVLGRPTLTTVVDTYSRCIMGFHLGMERPSAAVTGLALRHAILPKQYRPGYEPQNLWESYGVPQYLYTDAGADFTSAHMDQVASSLGIVLCRRRRPAEGGIVERPFGTVNSEFFATLPGYTTRHMKPHLSQAEAEACLTLEQLEGLLVRYIVDNYNQQPDARVGQDSRMGRWQSGRMAQASPMAERELDVLLMRQDRRRVYQGGHIRFANLIYQGEYLGGYVGEAVVLRYDPRDITRVYVYRQQGSKDVFLTRAHAQNLETERLSLADAKAISRRLREARQSITNQSVLAEVRDRLQFVDDVLTGKIAAADSQAKDPAESDRQDASELPVERRPLPDIRVYDYDQLRHEYGLST